LRTLAVAHRAGDPHEELAAPLINPMLEGLDIHRRVKGMSKHPARSFQIALVIEKVTQQQKLFVGALAGNLRKHVASMTGDPFIIHLRKIPKPRNPFLSAKGQLLLYQAHCFRVVILKQAHNGVTLSKHCGYFVLRKCAERKGARSWERGRGQPGSASTASTFPGRQRIETAIGRQQISQSSIVE
jgi:hypothetical protein